MNTPLKLSCLLAAVAVLLAACGSSGSPTPTATLEPTATTLPPPEATRHVIYSQDGNVWVADADGANQRQLTSGGPAGFAGAGLTPEGQVALHYTVMDEATRTFTLYRELPGATAQQVFTFQGSDKNAEFSVGNAAVSAAGDAIAFVDHEGLALYFTNIGNTRRLLNNQPCTDETGTDCWGYYFPSWSPDGARLAAQKLLFEGNRTMIVDQASDPAAERQLDYAAFPGQHGWSADGTRMCAPEDSFNGGPAFIVDIETGTGGPVFNQGEPAAASPMFDCSFAPDGRLAVIYGAANETASQLRLAIIGADGARLLDTAPAGSTGTARVRWLDEVSVLVDYSDLPPQVVDMDGNVRPFTIDIEELIDVVEY